MKAQDLKNSVLQIAIQGKLVEQNSNDEPASILLEKIKIEKEKLIKEKKIKREKILPDINEEEKYFEIPDSWEWVRLGNIVEIKQWKTIPKENLLDSGYPVYGANGIIGYTNVYNHIEPVLLLTCRGATCGATNISKKYSYINGNAFAFDKVDECITIEYLKILFDAIDLKSKGVITGTAQPQITQQSLLPLPIPIPPLNEQKRILCKIQEVLEKIDEYDKFENELSKLEKDFPKDMKKSILQYAIQGKLVEQNSNDEPASILLEKIKVEKEQLIKEKKIKREKLLSEISEEEKPFEIPYNWEWVRLSVICEEFKYGSSAKSEIIGDIPVLRMGNIQDGKIDWNNLVYTSNNIEINKYKLQKGDLLFNRTNSQELVGKTAIYNGEYPAIYAGYLIKIKLINGIVPEYINYFMSSPMARERCWRVKSNGVSQSNINAEKLKEFIIPLPPVEEQKRIVAKIDELLFCVDKLQHKINNKDLLNRLGEAKTIEVEDKKVLISN